MKLEIYICTIRGKGDVCKNCAHGKPHIKVNKCNNPIYCEPLKGRCVEYHSEATGDDLIQQVFPIVKETL